MASSDARGRFIAPVIVPATGKFAPLAVPVRAAVAAIPGAVVAIAALVAGCQSIAGIEDTQLDHVSGKASNTGRSDYFGVRVSLWGDTLAVGAHGEDSSATGIGGNQADNSALDSGAVYVFEREGTAWQQQAYLKARPGHPGDGRPRWLETAGRRLEGACMVQNRPMIDSPADSGPAAGTTCNDWPDSGLVKTR